MDTRQFSNEEIYEHPDRVLAIIRDPGYGLRDLGVPMLSFMAYTHESSGSLQCLFQPAADRYLIAAGCSDVRNLDGTACWVRNDGPFVRLVGPAKI